MATKKTGNAAKGFASSTDEEKKATLKKSLATRRANKAKKLKALEEAKVLRDEASALHKKAELLEQEADSIDGLSSSAKTKKQHEAQLANDITERFGRSVSSQYLKVMISHAILRGTPLDGIVTPTHACMDILQHPDSSRSAKDMAIKMLQAFESAKPAIVEDDKGDALGSVEEQMKKLQAKHKQLSPKH